ncbi:MAG: hypothetical protein JNN27_01360 [Planctomycetes bacterium]|nr:hypothetical protein [Planctomycetota bacterium]
MRYGLFIAPDAAVHGDAAGDAEFMVGALARYHGGGRTVDVEPALVRRHRKRACAQTREQRDALRIASSRCIVGEGPRTPSMHTDKDALERLTIVVGDDANTQRTGWAWQRLRRRAAERLSFRRCARRAALEMIERLPQLDCALLAVRIAVFARGRRD